VLPKTDWKPPGLAVSAAENGLEASEGTTDKHTEYTICPRTEGKFGKGRKHETEQMFHVKHLDVSQY